MSPSGQDPSPTDAATAAAVAALRSRGERVTRARRAVLEVLAQACTHLDADGIASHAVDRAPGIHRATVYRTLATLGELGIVTHTHIGGAATVYHLTPLATPGPAGRGHTHARCTECGRVLDVPLEVLDPVAQRLEHDLGFTLDPTHGALLGLCAVCCPS